MVKLDSLYIVSLPVAEPIDDGKDGPPVLRATCDTGDKAQSRLQGIHGLTRETGDQTGTTIR